MADNNNILTGRLDVSGGYYYIGQIQDGKANGIGKYYDPDGTILREGTFKDGKLNGYGVTYVHGQKFHEGLYVNGEKEGHGVMYALGVKAYEGDFHNGNRHGKGTQWWLDKSMYVGDFVDDKRTGKGILYLDDIKHYEGDFVDGEFHGLGTIYDENGNVTYSGKFANNKIATETVSPKGNQWVSVSSENGSVFAESYQLIFNLTPHIQGIKDTLNLYVRYTLHPDEKLSALGIYAEFNSKGNAFVMGGGPVDLHRGMMKINLNDSDSITIKPIDVLTEIDKNGNIGAREIVAYPIDRDTFKKICDAKNISIELTGGIDWNRKLIGEQILFLVRASWNGIINNSDYSSYLQKSSAAPKFVNSGCFIATAIYGSYDCPEVWTLRRFRDYFLDKTVFGRVFIKLYYAISPFIVKWFGNTSAFRLMFKKPLDTFVSWLKDKGYMDTPYHDKY